jgi:hypothetical protein
MLLKELMMNTLALPRPSGHDRWFRLLDYAAGLLGGVHDGLRMVRHYNALDSLTDSQLARRGLKREDLARVAVAAIG